MGIICTIVEVMEWLDAQIAWREAAKASKYLDNHIRACDTPEERMIHVYDGVVQLADVLGKELLREEHTKDYEYLYFEYKGYTVFGLVPKETADE